VIRLGDTVSFVVEVPRFSFVKRSADGTVDFVSPLPCPFNYGSVPGTTSGDGDPADVVLLGPRLARGARSAARVVGIVDFVDDGAPDPKHVCSRSAPTFLERSAVRLFFGGYARAKRLLNHARGKSGRTAFDGARFLSCDADPSGRTAVEARR
jgi:inorganic pyrophosphatase